MSFWGAHYQILIQFYEASQTVDLERITLSGNMNLHKLHFKKLFFKDTLLRCHVALIYNIITSKKVHLLDRATLEFISGFNQYHNYLQFQNCQPHNIFEIQCLKETSK
jgi:hypothetical protein